MTIFPWLMLVAIIVLVSLGLLAIVSRMWSRHGRQAPFTIGVVSALMVAMPLLLLVLAWGIVLKPR